MTAWLTLSVTPSTGWLNVFRKSTGGETADVSPAILLQQSSDGRRRAVFAAITGGGELVPACDVEGYRHTIDSETYGLSVGVRTGW
jgi:hypothetical protein